MALDRLTKVDGGGISTTSDYRVGIITASKFVGPFDGTGGNFSGVITATNGVFSGNISAVDGNFSGNVTIGGTLTYEDVTNIDSVGIITAQQGIHVGAGVSAVGVGTFGSLDISGDIDVDGHTNLDNVSIAGVTTITQDLDVDGHTNLDNISVAGVTTFSNDVTFTGNNYTGAIWDKSEDHLKLKDNTRLRLGSGINDFNARHDGTYTWLQNAAGPLLIDCSSSYTALISGNNLAGGKMARFIHNGAAELYWDNSKKLETSSVGVSIPQDLDVDGHTNLDNVSIAGVTTHYEKLLISQPGGTTSTNVVPLEVQAYRGDSTTGITTVLFEANGLKRPEFIFNNTHNGNWNNSNGQTQHWRMLWRAPNETQTTDDVVELKPNTSITGSLNNFGIKVTDNTNGLRHAAYFSSQAQSFYANNSFVLTMDQVGLGITDSIYHYNDSDTKIRFPSNDTISFETAGSTRFGLNSSGNVEIHGTQTGNNVATIYNGTGALSFYASSNSGVNRDFRFFSSNSNSNESLRISSNGNVNVYKDLDVDGHTELDNVNIAGVATFNHGGSEVVRINSGGILLYNDLSFFGASTHAYWDHSDNQFKLNDNTKLSVGTGNDLQIYHLQSDNNSYIVESGSGSLMIQGDIINIGNVGSSKYYIRCFEDGAVQLRYGNNLTKLATTTTGIEVTGEVAASQDYPNIRPLLDFNFAATKKLDPRLEYERTGPASFTDEFGKVVIVGDNVPRFDHDPTTRESKGLLIEESRTNLLKYSVDFASIGGYNANYSAARSTLTSTTELAPDGTNTASKYVRTAGQGTGEVAIIVNPIGTSSGTVYTTSVFVKNFGTNSVVELVNVRATSVNDDSQFNLANGTITTEGSDISLTTITPYPNDWYRISVTATANNNGYFWVRIYNQPEGSGFILWGGQVEAGSFPTSYIPTYNNASVTRGQDFLVMEGSDVDDNFNPTEGTMFYEASVTNLADDNQPIVSFRNSLNTGEEYFSMGHAIGGSAGTVRVWSKNSDGQNVHLTAHTGLVADTPYKHAFGYAYNNYSDAFTQGTTSKQVNTTSGNYAMMATGVVNELRFGAYYSNLKNYKLKSGYIKRFSYWPVRLTNTQLKTYIS